MKIPCYFCQTELEAKKISDHTHQAFCHVCPEIVSTAYGSFPPDAKVEFRSAAISFQDNGKEYRAYYYRKSFHINEITNFTDMNGHSFYGSKPVMKLSFCPDNITPYNIKEKFQTLKVWS